MIPAHPASPAYVTAMAVPFRRTLQTLLVAVAIAAVLNTALGFPAQGWVNTAELAALFFAWRTMKSGALHRAAVIAFYSLALMFSGVLLFGKGAGSIGVAGFPTVIFLSSVFLERRAYWGLCATAIVGGTAVIAADATILHLSELATLVAWRVLFGLWVILVASAFGGRWLMDAIRASFARERELSGALRSTQDHIQRIFRSSQNALVVSRMRDGVYLEVNDAYLTMFGYRREDVLGRSSLDLGVWEDRHDRQRFVALLTEFRAVRSFETRLRKNSGEVIEVQLSAEVLELDGEPHAVISTADVTARRDAERRAAYLATRDALTGLPNRALALDRLQRALEHAERDATRVAVLHLDIDRFKAFNDSFGREAGNALLGTISARLQLAIGGGNTLARIGADEFLGIVEGLDADAAAADAVIARILHVFEAPVEMGGSAVRVSCTAGVAIGPEDAREAELLLNCADTAMHAAKADARGSHRRFEPMMSERDRNRLQLEASLREAVAHGALRLVYQPKFDIHTRRVTGLEALARWTHPRLGPISPARFIAIAEESEIIHELGAWVIRECCAQLARWKAQRTPLVPIAVNLSVRQLTPALPEIIARAVAASGIDPGMIELEVTESMLIESPEATRKVLEEVSGNGSLIMLDDFGVGYSSLNYLKHLPIHGIKVDRSFVTDLAHSRSDAAIVKAVVGLAHGLGFHVVAEGIETEAQMDAVRALGCDEVQGFLLSRPVGADEIGERFLRASTASVATA